MAGRAKRRSLIAGVVVVALLVPLVHPRVREPLQRALWGVGAPLGPTPGPFQEKECSFKDAALSDEENERRTDAMCRATLVSACGSMELAYVDHYTELKSRCIDKIPGCYSRDLMLPGRRVKFQCLSAPRSPRDPDREWDTVYADETEVEH